MEDDFNLKKTNFTEAKKNPSILSIDLSKNQIIKTFTQINGQNTWIFFVYQLCHHNSSDLQIRHFQI